MKLPLHLVSRRPFELDFNIISGTFEDFDWSNPLVCHGKGGGGSSGGTTTSSTQPPQQVLDAYQTAINAAQQAASAPLQQYSGPTVAGFTPDQLSAFGTINNAQGAAQPFIQQAQGLIQQGTQPLWSGVQQFSPQAIQNYSSPYTQQVLNAAVAQQGNTDAQQQQALKGNAISQGAWGGDRAGVASAVLSGQQDLANNATNANILNQGYSQGVQEFNTQQQAQLGANEANSYLNQQGAFGLANLGNEALGTQLTGAAAQAQSGAAQQQLGQELLNVPYQQFLQQQAYPFQTAQFFGNVAEGIGSQSGGTSTTTQPSPNSSKGKNRGGRIPYQRGGSVPHLAGGGTAFGVPDQSVSYVPATTLGTRGEGPPKPPVVPGQPNKGLSITDLFTIGKGLDSLLGKSGSKSAMPQLMMHGDNPVGTPGADGLSSILGNQMDNPVGTPGADGLESILSSSGGADAASTAASGASDAGFLDALFKNRGGRIGRARGGSVPQKLAVGGDVLPDVLSAVGDVVGAFFGMPMAGDMGVSMLSNVDGGATKPDGVGHQMLNSVFARGGMATGYDDGGLVGGDTPTQSAMPVTGSNQQTQTSNYNNMTPEQLQMIVMRLPAGSMQQKTATAVLQQKRMMPNVGVAAQGGFGTQAAPQPQQQQQQQAGGGMMALGGMASGGIPAPLGADDLDDQMNQLYNGDTSALGIYIPAPPPAMSAMGTAPSAPAAASSAGPVPQGTAPDSASPPPAAGGSGPPPAPTPQGAATPDAAAADRSKALQELVAMNDKGGDDDNSGSNPSVGDPHATRREVNPWVSLATGALAAAAGTSPYRMQNAAAGALAGLKNYGDQVKETDSVNETADKLLAEAQQHRDALGVQSDTQHETERHNKADEALSQKKIDALAAKTANGKLDQDNLDFMADQYLAGDKSVVSGLGYGNAGALNRAALRSTIQQRAKAAGMSGAEVADALADYQGTIAEKRTVGTRTGAIKVASEAVNGAADLALESSNNVDRTQYPDINAVYMNAAKRNGDPAVVDFAIKNNTLINEYAAAQNPRGVPRVEDKKYARDMLETSFNNGQYEAGVKAIKSEIANIKKATATVRGKSSDADAAGTSPNPTTGKVQLTPDQIQQIQQYRAQQKQQGGGP